MTDKPIVSVMLQCPFCKQALKTQAIDYGTTMDYVGKCAKDNAYFRIVVSKT
jgi:hypothetical protein